MHATVEKVQATHCQVVAIVMPKVWHLPTQAQAQALNKETAISDGTFQKSAYETIIKD